MDHPMNRLENMPPLARELVTFIRGCRRQPCFMSIECIGCHVMEIFDFWMPRRHIQTALSYEHERNEYAALCAWSEVPLTPVTQPHLRVQPPPRVPLGLARKIRNLTSKGYSPDFILAFINESSYGYQIQLEDMLEVMTAHLDQIEQEQEQWTHHRTPPPLYSGRRDPGPATVPSVVSAPDSSPPPYRSPSIPLPPVHTTRLITSPPSPRLAPPALPFIGPQRPSRRRAPPRPLVLRRSSRLQASLAVATDADTTVNGRRRRESEDDGEAEGRPRERRRLAGPESAASSGASFLFSESPLCGLSPGRTPRFGSRRRISYSENSHFLRR